jgi:hypothetical protein
VSNDERHGAGVDDDAGSGNAKGSGRDAEGPDDDRRRRLLILGGLAAVGATGAVGAWYGTRDEPEPEATPTQTEPSTVTDEATPTPEPEPPAAVLRHAPDLYFGRLEKWFPTDPRQYLPAGDSEASIPLGGFAALQGYSDEFRSGGGPPHPTVFYQQVSVSAEIDAIQYWLYSVFDQFTVNFHWHDWELLQVFVDSETGDPLLLSASAHSRKVPNNEVLEPDVPDDRRIGILSEVGSHSSATDVNEVVPSFERVTEGIRESDVTNDVLETVRGTRLPFAYGLPRDEGARLPFVMPELDGHRLDRHPELDLDRLDFIDPAVTVDDWKAIPSPPASIPVRESGRVFTHESSPTDGSVEYELVDIQAVENTVSDFKGRQLSFQFRIPGYVEDRLAGHITDVGIPWDQDRFDDPISDVTDPGHRDALDGERSTGVPNRVVGGVRQLREGADGTVDRLSAGAADALSVQIPVSFHSPPAELAVRIASPDPVATVTNDGTFGVLDVDAGEHELVINGPGYAPVAARFDHDGGLVRPGADGTFGVVGNADAVRIRADGRDSTGIRRASVVEDYAGTVYDGRPPQTDRLAIPVHRAGSYTLTIVDRNGRPGSYRFTPNDIGEDGAYDPIESTETGTLSLLDALRAFLVDLRRLATELRDPDDEETVEQRPVDKRIARAIESIDAAIETANAGEPDAADEQITEAIDQLEAGIDFLRGSDTTGYSDAAITLLVRRLRTGIARAETARSAEFADR